MQGLRHPYTANLQSETSGDSQNTPLHCADDLNFVQDCTMLSQKSMRWRRALSPRKASLPHEDWVLRGLTLHQLKDIITDIYASKAKADARSGPTFTFVNPVGKEKKDYTSQRRFLEEPCVIPGCPGGTVTLLQIRCRG